MNNQVNLNENKRIQFLFRGLILPMAIWVLKTVPHLSNQHIPGDTFFTYFPLAKKLLENPSTFFSNIDSLTVAPGITVLMALHNVQMDALKTSNLAFSILIIWMLFDIGRRLSGYLAGSAIVWFYILSPLIESVSIVVLSEAPFMFFCTLWLWATVSATQDINPVKNSFSYSLSDKYKFLFIFLAGFSLACATFVRGTYMYWIPCIIILSIVVYIFPQFLMRLLNNIYSENQLKTLFKRIGIIHLIAFCLFGAYVLHNKIEFGKAMMSTGTGASLYFGNNPILGGYDPSYYGIIFDDTAITNGNSHLSVEGDELLLKTAKNIIINTPIPILTEMYIQKIGTFFFFGRLHLEKQFFSTRSWRIILVLFSIAGLWFFRHHLIFLFIFGMIFYQCMVHLPVLYTPRYSVGSIEIPLIILSGFGLSSFYERRKNKKMIFAFVLFMSSSVVFGHYHQRFSTPVMPQLIKGPHRLISKALLQDIKISGIKGNLFQEESTIIDNNALIVWNNATLKIFGEGSILKIGNHTLNKKCDSIWLGFQAPNKPITHKRFDIRGLNPQQDITIGFEHLSLHESQGDLTIKFNCPINSKIQLNELEIYSASMSVYKQK